MVIRLIFNAVFVVQFMLAARFLRRMLLAMHSYHVPAASCSNPAGSASVILPVLNEVDRLEPCLRSLSAQGEMLREIIVVDGGSSDGTQTLIERWAAVDSRIKFVQACDRPTGWNGKSWGLQFGLREIDPKAEWVLTIDADVRCSEDAISRVVAFAESNRIPVLSVATRQVAHTFGLSFLHPSLLSTLVYRFGPPGRIARDVSDVQFNGQFGLYRRDALIRSGGFGSARDSICEDVTLARHLFLAGYDVGFYEGDDLAETEMYASGHECITNWPRSLSLHDRILPDAAIFGLVNILFLQVIPIVMALVRPKAVLIHPGLVALNRLLLGIRLGVLVGMRRAYSEARWSYWFSPLADPISLIAYLIHLMRRTHTWRGQRLVAETE